MKSSLTLTLNIYISFNPVILLPGIYPIDLSPYMHNEYMNIYYRIWTKDAQIVRTLLSSVELGLRSDIQASPKSTMDDLCGGRHMR